MAAFQNPFDVLFIAVLAAGPAVLLSAIVAGYVAASVAKTGQAWPRSRWVTQGLGTGAVSGACSLIGWFTSMNASSGVPPLLLAGMAGVGAVAGALAGVLVALYSWRVTQSRLAV